jgi:hypothetical protein
METPTKAPPPKSYYTPTTRKRLYAASRPPITLQHLLEARAWENHAHRTGAAAHIVRDAENATDNARAIHDEATHLTPELGIRVQTP